MFKSESFEFARSSDLYPRNYLWLVDDQQFEPVEVRIPAPQGFTRSHVDPGSFEEWLRYLPVKQKNALVSLYDGSKKLNQSAHHAVLNIDTGTENLQQCADAVIRLRAEYLYAQNRQNEIKFCFTSGEPAYFSKWRAGFRATVNGQKVLWRKIASQDGSYTSFRSYLKMVFTYAGTVSLEKEMQPIDLEKIRAGDVFIQPGTPGHAVIVIDTAFNRDLKKIFLLAQSYMPAQDIHILKNPNNSSLTPWYDMKLNSKLLTPEWIFQASDLHRFR